MSLVARFWIVALGLILVQPVWADEDDEDDEDDDAEVSEDTSDPAQKPVDDERFFVFKPSEDRDVTAWSGSLTSSSFFYGERASGDDPLIVDDPVGGIVIPAEVDSPRSRLFTDMRARVNAAHIAGSYWNMRLDTRARLVPNDQTQSGTFSDQEYDVRELFFGRDGENTDFYVGRQFVNELAAVKFDGLKIDYESNARWHYLAFAGLFPVRGSRSITSDYPKAQSVLGIEDSKRVMPVTAGVGAAYRLEKLYGSFGVVGIVPLTDDQAEQSRETQRIFATSTGYWRESQDLDIYHFLVFDATGADGAALTNFTVGANYTPAPSLRVTGQVTHIDTETLNVQAQTRLENPAAPDGSNLGVVLNNIQVARLSQDEARLGVSGSFLRRRFEVYASGSIRRRPEVTLIRDTGIDEILLPSAQAADLTLGVVDRRSYKDMRLGLTYSRAFALGDQNVNRSEFQVIRADARRDVRDGKASVEGSLTFVSSSDDNDAMGCNNSLQPLSCYGTSKATTFTLGLMGVYRIDRDWLGIFSTALGTQSISVEDVMQERLDLPTIITASVFLRIAYRF